MDVLFRFEEPLGEVFIAARLGPLVCIDIKFLLLALAFRWGILWWFLNRLLALGWLGLLGDHRPLQMHGLISELFFLVVKNGNITHLA